ncbi:MAG: hypothetical protein K8I02_04130 [Candidatus Methylomirabilis sp.]|nr:hypothetical protein [Deltaproteobacteria bacterium]
MGETRSEKTSATGLGKYFPWLAAWWALVALALAAVYFFCDYQAKKIDSTLLSLLAGSAIASFIPFFKEITLGSLSLRRHDEEIQELQSWFLLGQVVKSDAGRLFFIDRFERKHELPNDNGLTAEFLQSARGYIELDDNRLSKYADDDPMESVRNARIVLGGHHYFVILNGMRFHVGSAGFLSDWGREGESPDEVPHAELIRFPRG